LKEKEKRRKINIKLNLKGQINAEMAKIKARPIKTEKKNHFCWWGEVCGFRPI
jgi:hypothetical protein